MANKKIKSVNLLPEFLRTEKNSKFLSNTIDQLIQPPELERIDGYIGSKLSPTYNADKDSYINENLPLRKNYQLEPALVINDAENKINDVIGIDDLINELALNGAKVDNLDRLFKSDYYSYDPNIDWDKFVNFQEYYWLTTGPDAIEITGKPQNTTSTYTVIDNPLTTSFIFTPDGLTEDPLITLYRGNTYKFLVDSKYKFYIKTQPILGDSFLYNINVSNNGTSTGVISIVVNDFTPDELFYISDLQEYAQGKIYVKSIDQDTFLDVDAEIVGKKYYTSYSGVNFSNGMKIKFKGNVYPDYYKDKEFFVEGVGTSIKLIDYSKLAATEEVADVFNENFDASPFDSFPFDKFKALPIQPEYFTINRASNDLNPWSRYNRWFHSDTIKLSAELNNKQPIYPLDKRAQRPIIEFNANLQLYNYGTIAVDRIDLLDNFTKDAFSIVEGSSGYYIDGVPVEQGNRVIFNADTDADVRGKIYTVHFVTINNVRRINLKKSTDHTPPNKASASILSGDVYGGTSWWYNGDKWIFSQQHTKLNEPPLFDVFDNTGKSYSEDYETNFRGTKIFSYDIGAGTVDPILGIPLKYENSIGTGSYLFKNDFMVNTLTITGKNNTNNTTVPIGQTFLKQTEFGRTKYINVWKQAFSKPIPIVQFQTTNSETNKIEIIVLDKIDSTDLKVDVLLSNTTFRKKLFKDEYLIVEENKKFFVSFKNPIAKNTNVTFKIYTNQAANKNGYYDTPIGLTNNPKNDPISYLTLSEMSDHLQTMVESSPDFLGNYPGRSNIRNIGDLSQYGSRLISNINPVAFANFFIGKKDHSLIDAITKVADQYNFFKLNFLSKISEYVEQPNTNNILEEALKLINENKIQKSSYYYSDMIPYGTDKSSRVYNVRNIEDTIFPLLNTYNPDVISNTACLIYLNNHQLIIGKDYEFIVDDSSVNIKTILTVNDTLEIVEYVTTEGCFVPPTPTKLGLYPAFEPKMFYDDTYANDPVLVIQGHDGSIMKAYNDYRDDVILELEKRIFNNIKAKYRYDLLDINKLLPGFFRNNLYHLSEINTILAQDFIKWAGFYGIDYTKNITFDPSNDRTWNFKDSYIPNINYIANGTWKAIFKYLYDTERPHTHPWEMLGFTIKPDWWDEEYGVYPYTSGNDILWDDLVQGRIKQGPRQGVDLVYARPSLKDVLPVDENGNLILPQNLISNSTPYNKKYSWQFGDYSPAEVAWRKSSYYPYSVQKLLALLHPSVYASLMYDPIRIKKNLAKQWVYEDQFLNFSNLKIHSLNQNVNSGYSVFVSEIGNQKNSNYIDMLAFQLTNNDFRLFHKVGGFVNKNKLQIAIDSFDPLSTGPGALLPQENYNLILNVSNPIKSSGISGIIIQRVDGKFVVKGYDNINPYFTIFDSIRTTTTPAITVGGISEPYVLWTSSTSSGSNGLSASETTTANSALTGKFYQAGQIVFYNNKFYRTKTSHISEAIFNDSYFQELPTLPIKGGATVQLNIRFSDIERQVSYGTEFDRLQDVYDLIIGYGKWLETQGFIFDDFNTDLNSILDWNFSGKEFLYWTTQNWSNNSIITLSPFANKIKFKFINSVVDNVFNEFYQYSLLQSNGTLIPSSNVTVNREDGLFTLGISNFNDGIYFARLNSIQKEHAMVFDNKTIFNDTIYDIETGYRQRRMKISGFRTGNWDGDYFSPGFIYDEANIKNWKEYTDYKFGEIVKFNGKYYSSNSNIPGNLNFDFNNWTLLYEKPTADLIPNFDYKINQFEDFYSLDIDNFDDAQQKMAQHLIGYTPRVYLNSIFTNPIAQYKFYQGFIKEKGTRNALDKLSKATIHNLQGKIDFNEEWAFRIGYYGSYETFKEIEFPLQDNRFIENPQTIKFTTESESSTNVLIQSLYSNDLVIKPDSFDVDNVFAIKNQQDEFDLQVAGYVRLDDVNYTAFNESELLTIAQNSLVQENDVTWIGFKNDGDWDVFRYTLATRGVINAKIKISGKELIITTNNFHGLSVGDIISVVQVDDQINGVYKIKSIPTLKDIIVPTTLEEIADIEFTLPGLIFKFESQRFNNFISLPSNKKLLSMPYKTKFWIDNDKNENWSVYEKVRNYKPNLNIPEGLLNQQLGWNILSRSNVTLVSAPEYYSNNNYGKVNVYIENINFKFILNDTQTYYPSNVKTDFGYSLEYDPNNFKNTGYGLIFAGAPSVSFVKAADVIGNIRYASGTGEQSIRVQEGAVKIVSIDPVLISEKSELVLLSPNPSNYEKFGSSVYVQKETTGTSKLLFVGACGTQTTGTGHVYSFLLTTGQNVSINLGVTGSEIFPGAGIILSTGNRWGHCISGTDDGAVIAISAPGYVQTGTNNTVESVGIVQIFDKTSYKFTLHPPGTWVGENKTNSKFGDKVFVEDTGKYVFVTAPNFLNSDQSRGSVVVYEMQANTASIVNVIYNPVSDSSLIFGVSLDANTNADTLMISSIGTDKFVPMSFDKFVFSYSTEELAELINWTDVDASASQYINDQWSEERAETIFDKGSTRFFDTVVETGLVYVFDKKEYANNINYVLTHEIRPKYVTSNTNFGFSISLNSDKLYVGAPAYSQLQTNSTYHLVTKLDNTFNGWKLLRNQEEVVDPNVVQKITLIDSLKEEVVDYLEIIDPLKGKISGLAEQELRYKSFNDPAIYSNGSNQFNVDETLNWKDEHVGELWWDLSSVKYIWYEQGDLIYRKNNWGKLFPGSTIDIYEWVESEYLPSEYASTADTPQGLTKGISGTPRYDDTVFSVKEKYDPVSNSFTNLYYYWVKNKVLIPNVPNRRNSAYQVAKIISDPMLYGLSYVSLLSKNAIALSNIGNKLIGSRINLNISYDIIDNKIPKYTEWLLLQENSETSVPNALLEKKLFDSLLGRDSLGNIVPDPMLPERSRYGISIRPRQGLFKNRFEALRNLIEYVNGVLAVNQVSGNYSFKNLEDQELIPIYESNEYDEIVEDNQGLELINTRKFTNESIPALKCFIKDGKIKNVIIDNSGIGYKTPPTIQILGENNSAELASEIDSLGRIVNVKVVNPGKGYTSAPALKVRGYTVIVVADALFNNKWTKFVYNADIKQWVREKTQQYNTTLYWKYIDWKSDTYNKFKDYRYTVNDVYELERLTEINITDYVKVKNSGNGTYIIVEKIDSTVRQGSFNNDYDLVYSENGTIQILDTVWNFVDNYYNFDQGNNFDQTLYDQTPDIELKNILYAIKLDLFTGQLKIHWNKFFFKAVKYALSEQKLLDWAFKTSFITVTNEAGLLDTRPVYKLQNSSYFEDYIAEVKPFHTKIRNFVTKYNAVDNSNSYITDFDLPAKYNKDSNVYESITLGNSNLDTLPWKSWADNYTYKVGNITVGNPGSGYFVEPIVEILTAPGDAGYGATAKAYIRSGSIFLIEVTNPGTGYVKPPLIVIKDNGYSDLIPATAYAQLTNEKIRVNKIGMKFDRISSKNEIGEKITTDRFVCNGSAREFVLNWLAENNKSKFSITLNGNLVLNDDYTVEFYSEKFNNYSKKYSRIKFLKYVPSINQILEVTYPKSIELYNATERILNDYKPTQEMPGIDLPQLMYGVEYPQNIIEGLTFPISANWDVDYSAYDNFKWGSNVTDYSVTTIETAANLGTTLIFVQDIDNLKLGQFVNFISVTATTFNTSTVTIEAINTLTNQLTLNTATTRIINVGEKVEFWSTENNESDLDHTITAGSWDGTLGTFVGALGINPEDIIIDGDKFLNMNSGSGPEEFVPGHVVESLAINVFTKNSFGAPIVFSGNFGVPDGQGATYQLPFAPPNINSISVTFNYKQLLYVANSGFSSQNQFSIDWETNELIIPEQEYGGTVGFTILSIGGGKENSGPGVIDSNSITVDQNISTSTAQIVSLASYNIVKSAYVTIDGIAVPPRVDDLLGYELTYANNDNKRAAVNVYGIPPGKYTIQAWFFSTPYKYFNEVKEQNFVTTSTPVAIFNLDYPPGNIQPAVANIIVELNDGVTRRKLVPPSITYYQVTNSLNYTFAIDNNIVRPPNTFDLTNVNAYLNGILLRPGFDYSISSPNNTITFVNGLLKVKDVLAIIGLVPGDYEFNLINNTVVLSNPITFSSLKVITYTDHDGMLMRTERFQGNPSRRYKISRAVLNDNYVWVTVNGISLNSKLDYEVLDDQVTIQISDAYEHKPEDDIVIVSLSNENLASTVLGYKIFNDIFNRTHFKRIAKANTTYLVQPLSFTDNKIYVADTTKLTPPSKSQKIPGVVWIDGERIEFWRIEDNSLAELRRATLGTAPSFYCDINSKVIDQGYEQTIPFKENIYKQVQYTTTSTNTYIISTVTTTATGDGIVLSLPQSYVFTTNKIDTSLASSYAAIALRMASGLEPVDLKFDLNGDNQVTADDSTGYLRLSNRISLGYVPASTSNFSDLLIKENIVTNNIDAIDQVAVYYGGRLLRKRGTFHHDTTVSYDYVPFNIRGSISSLTQLPQTVISGTAYLLTSTNQVWVYTGSIESTSVNGYVYKGVSYLEPEFSITTSTQALTLNIKNGIQNNVKLTIMKKEFPRNKVWNDEISSDSTISLLDSTTEPAKFLQFKPTDLPDNYYYGGDPTITNDNGFALTDNSDEPLEGF